MTRFLTHPAVVNLIGFAALIATCALALFIVCAVAAVIPHGKL